MRDLLTWEGVRAVATCEVLTAADQTIRIVTANPQRPPIKAATEQHWFHEAVPMTPEPGAIVYARTAWRRPWRPRLLQQLQAPVVLVSTFSDPMIKPQAVCEMFAPGSPVQHWFGVQAATAHPRLTAMPLGVEGSIVPTLQAAERHATRTIPLYLNFQLRGRGTQPDAIRAALWRQFAGQSWVTADHWAPGGEAAYGAQLGRSQFVLSPPGIGWDCYRTYEAIAMGAIPIVRRERPMTDVCEPLPVLIVDDWNEITPERLRHEWARRRPGDLRTLTLSYWRTRMETTAAALVPQAVAG
jgi:hypothetical protein